MKDFLSMHTVEPTGCWNYTGSMTEWRPVVGYEDDYEVSEYGDVRRVSAGSGTQPGRLKKQSMDRKGYMYVGFTGKRCVRVQRIVAMAFHPNPDNLPLVRHLDGNPLNNHYSNLSWGTAMDNTNDRKGHGRKSGWHHLQTHCKHGHELTGANLGWKSRKGRDPIRLCMTCRRSQSAAQTERRRAA